MFQFRRFPTYDYFIHHRLLDLLSSGFPHSDIHGSMAAFASPWLFADCCVLRRLLVPRHSPCALCSLTCFSFLRIFSLGSFFPRLNLKLSFYPLYVKLIHFTFHFSLFSFQGAFVRSKTFRPHLTWWAQVDSNHRPHAYQACALTC